MTTHTAPAATAASSGIAPLRPLDPLTAETLARYARQQMIAGFVRDVWKAVIKAVAGGFRNRAVYQELSELPDHLLHDIGVRRDQVSAVAYGGLSRPASELELATRQGAVSFFEHRPAAVAAAPRDPASGDDRPLAA